MLPAIDDSDYFVSEELRGMSTKVIEYLMDNFASPLGFSSLRPESLHHFVDGLLAFRAFFCSIGYLELSKEIEDCLDEIQKFAHDIDYKSLQDNVVSDKMQFEEKINKDISLIKETFYKTYKKLLK